MKRFMTFGAMATSAVLSLGLAGGMEATETAGITATVDEAPASITLEAGDSVPAATEKWRRVTEISTSTPTILMSTATWCGPCKKVKPMLEELAKESQGRYLTVFLYDELVRKGFQPAPKQRYLPSLVVVRAGKYASVHQGCQDSKDGLRDQIREMLGL